MSTTVRERPIIFSAEMVRAILEGRKTRTMRIVKPQPESLGDGSWLYDKQVFYSDDDMRDHLFHEVYGSHGTPYGAVYGAGLADRLWVRETWGDCGDYDGNVILRNDRKALYRADRGTPQPRKWRPSIHMPRWASRITLEITDVDVQRVQEITTKQILREGIPKHYGPRDGVERELFRELWNKINGPGAWERNDWCWALSFRVLEVHGAGVIRQ